MAGSTVNVGLYTGRTKRAKSTILSDLAKGKIHLAVGTQALIEEDIEFANLGLVVVDEQHRLGVRAFDHLRRHSLNRGFGADYYEGRGFYIAVGRRNNAGPSQSIAA